MAMTPAQREQYKKSRKAMRALVKEMEPLQLKLSALSRKWEFHYRKLDRLTGKNS